MAATTTVVAAVVEPAASMVHSPLDLDEISLFGVGNSARIDDEILTDELVDFLHSYFDPMAEDALALGASEATEEHQPQATDKQVEDVRHDKEICISIEHLFVRTTDVRQHCDVPLYHHQPPLSLSMYYGNRPSTHRCTVAACPRRSQDRGPCLYHQRHLQWQRDGAQYHPNGHSGPNRTHRPSFRKCVVPGCIHAATHPSRNSLCRAHRSQTNSSKQCLGDYLLIE